MNLDGYMTVAQRLQLALERWPELRVVEHAPQLLDWPGGQVLLCEVSVYRTPEDTHPLVGRATEAIPGKTAFTRGSELMNGNTSALGRALGYAGIGIAGGLASADEVATAKQNQQPQQDTPPDTPRRPVQARTAQLGSKTAQTKPPATQAQLDQLAALGYRGPVPTSEGAAARLIGSITAADQDSSSQ